MRLRLFSLFVFALISISSQAEDTGELSGRILSGRDNQPLALVEVQLQGTTIRAVSGEDGKFKLTGVMPGMYVIQASTVGYYVTRQEITVAASDNKNFDIVLTPSNTTVNTSVDVSADAFEINTDTGVSGFTLEGDERKNLASVLADDPLRAVQSLPGVTSNNDFSSEFSVRGAPFDRIGIFFDGVLLHAPVHTTDGQPDNGSLTIFNGDLTQDITLYQGAWPVRYSDRTAGILAVESREGARDKVQGEISASASNAGVVLEGPWSAAKHGSWLLSFRKSYLQYILNRIDFGDQAPLAFGFMDGQARLSYDLSPKHNVSLTYLDGTSSVDRTRFRDELGPNTLMASAFHFTFLNAGSRYIPNEHLILSNHVSWTRDRGNTSNRDDLPLSDQYYTEWTWHGDATIVMKKNSTLEVGGQFRRMHQDNLDHQLVYTPELVSAPDSARGVGNEGGAYAQETLSMKSGRVRLTTGIRADDSSTSEVTTASPYASMSLQASKKTTLELSWGQFSQYPEFSEFFSTYAHGRLLPERATHYEAAIERRLNERTRLRVEFYDRQDRDLIARPALFPRLDSNGNVIPAVADAPLLNSERGYSRGFEIFVQRRTANGFTGWISYAYGRTLLTDGVLQTTFPTDYDQHHTVNAYLSRRLSSTVNVSARVTYGSGMPLPGFYEAAPGGYAISQSRNALRASAYERTDLRLNKAYVHEKIKTTLYGEIINITNHHNRDFDTPGPYDPSTQRTFPNFYSMFPILPSAGVVLEF